MSNHNKRVKQLANQYKRKGWTVEAHIPNFVTPDAIGQDNRIPDLVVTKNGAKRIIEVETKASLKKDKPQQSTFRRSAAQQNRTSFIIDVIK